MVKKNSDPTDTIQESDIVAKPKPKPKPKKEEKPDPKPKGEAKVKNEKTKEPKPKKVVSEKVLENLKKGQEALRLKRLGAKEKKEKSLKA